MGILDGKYHHGHFPKGLDINQFSIQKIHILYMSGFAHRFLSGWQKATIFNVNGMWLLEISRSGPVFLSFAVDIATRFGDRQTQFMVSRVRRLTGVFYVGNFRVADPLAKYIKQIIAATPIPTHPATLRLARTSNN